MMASSARRVLLAVSLVAMCVVASQATPIGRLRKDLGELETMLSTSVGRLPCTLPDTPIISHEPTPELVQKYFPTPKGIDRYMERVYVQHMKNSIKRVITKKDRVFATGLSEALTGTLLCRSGDSVENCPERKKLEFVKPGIESARKMLADCNAAIKSSGERLSISSGYRGTCHQYREWVKLFQGKYKSRDCDNGKASVWKCAGKVGGNFAFPGFSLHNSGAALDFYLRKGGKAYGASTSASNKAAWKTTKAWKWLTENASKYNFEPLSTEPWHWNYKMDLQQLGGGGAGDATATTTPALHGPPLPPDHPLATDNNNNGDSNAASVNGGAPTGTQEEEVKNAPPLPAREMTAIDWAWGKLRVLFPWHK